MLFFIFICHFSCFLRRGNQQMHFVREGVDTPLSWKVRRIVTMTLVNHLSSYNSMLFVYTITHYQCPRFYFFLKLVNSWTKCSSLSISKKKKREREKALPTVQSGPWRLFIPSCPINSSLHNIHSARFSQTAGLSPHQPNSSWQQSCQMPHALCISSA